MCNMTEEQRLINLNVPKGKIDLILDTDAYNEIDDQFALSYLLKSKERFFPLAIFKAIKHASIGIVPLPQKTSANGLSGFQTDKSIIAEARVSFKGASPTSPL